MIQDQVFLVHQKDLRTTANGSLYIHMVLVDRSGQILSRIWNATQLQYESIPEGGFLRVRGRVESYKGNLQFIVDALRAAEAGSFDPADFVPSTQRDVDEMWTRVLAILRTVKNPHLRALIAAFVKDEVIVAGFRKAPAAVQLHHAFIGGLLEHTLNVLELAVRIFGEADDSKSLYPKVNRDLVLIGIFLHDIGKTVELSYDTSFAYTTAGQLVGHITQAAIWIDQKVGDAEQQTGKRFPHDLQDLLTHIVLAHHGTHEFGSPRLPACPEAIVVHYLDNIDAKIHMFLSGIEGAKNAESDWTEYIKSLETRVFKKDVLSEPEAKS
jgi:3'-5' exoribonuclease